MASTCNSASSSKVVMLMSMEGERFEVEDSVARESKIINHMIEDDCADNVLPIPNVESSIFSRVIEWCKKHTQMEDDHSNEEEEEEEEEEELRSWADFDTDTLYDLAWRPITSDIKLPAGPHLQTILTSGAPTSLGSPNTTKTRRNSDPGPIWISSLSAI